MESDLPDHPRLPHVPGPAPRRKGGNRRRAGPRPFPGVVHPVLQDPGVSLHHQDVDPGSPRVTTRDAQLPRRRKIPPKPSPKKSLFRPCGSAPPAGNGRAVGARTSKRNAMSAENPRQIFTPRRGLFYMKLHLSFLLPLLQMMHFTGSTDIY